MAMAFNVSLRRSRPGRRRPWVRNRVVAQAGSVYAYIGQTFGPRWAFLAGWTLLLT
jgi:hypothetical protein